MKRMMGFDAEFVVKKGRGAYPASLVLPPQRRSIIVRDSWGRVGSLYHDGRQAEFGCIPDYCVDNLLYYMGFILVNANKILSEKKCTIDIKSGHPFSEKKIELGGDECKISGCEPDFDPYRNGVPVYGVREYRRVPFVFCGFHIHASLKNTKMSHDEWCKLSKLIDYVAGNQSVLLSGLDKYDRVRRRLGVGTAGRFRIKPYGIEYRVGGSSLMRHPAIAGAYFKMARVAVSIFEGHEEDSIMSLVKEHDIKRAIDTADRRLAADNYKKIAQRARELSELFDEEFDTGAFTAKSHGEYIIERLFNSGKGGIGAWPTSDKPSQFGMINTWRTA